MRLALLFLLFTSVASAQVTTGPKPPPPDPTISVDVHAKIRDLQREQDKLTIRAQQLRMEMTQIEGQFSNLQTQIDAAVAKAGVDGNVDPSKWKANLDTLKYEKVPEKPEEKKPEKKP